MNSLDNITEKDLQDASIMLDAINETLDLIRKTINGFVENNQAKIAHSYAKGIAIDMIAKVLTYPGVDMQKEADYLCAWVKVRHGIDIKIKIKNGN